MKEVIEWERRWREENRMECVGMHVVSERVVDWNDVNGLENGAMVQIMVNVQRGIGKRGKKKRVILGSQMEDLGSRSSAEEQHDVIDKAALMKGIIHFHPKSISSTDTPIQTRFHPTTLSSKHDFIQ